MTKTKTVIFIICFCVFGLSLTAQNNWLNTIVWVEKTPQNVAKLKTMCLDILMDWQDKIWIVASPDDLNKLKDAGILYSNADTPYDSDEDNNSNEKNETDKEVDTINRNKFDIKTHSSNRLHPFQNPFSIQTSINGAFHSYKEVETEVYALEQAYPNLVQVHIIGNSLEMRNIYALKISDNVQAEEVGEAEVIITGCHHAREWISVEVPLYVAKHLAENYATDSHIRDLLDRSQVWIVPLLNPDGLEYTIYFYRYWRKNMRDNKNRTYGVDPNRNYDYMWGSDDEGSSPDSYSYVYRGPAPFSEPETQAIRELFAERDFQVAINYHNYSQVIIYPWGYTNEPSDLDATLEEMAEEMAARMESVNGRVYGYGQAGNQLYVTNGGATDWALGVYGIPAFTIELPPVDQQHGGFYNPEEDIQSIVRENIPAMLYIIEWAIANK
ncbi:MAG: M14 family metallopeptidase [Candidatus Aminicenantes bacterium]|jgi:murein tripeptide amidase MpaA